MRLRKAQAALAMLTEHMIIEHGAPDDLLSSITIEHDKEHDKENELDPRAFCFVEKDNPTVIHCAKAIEDLPKAACVGVLYHELGHILLKAFHGDESEVDVDEWCVNFLPMANYTYLDTPYIATAVVGKSDVTRGRVAKSLQNVAPSFLRILEKYLHAKL